MNLHVHHGASRVVILAGPFAVKFPQLASWRQVLWGLLSNMRETERRNEPGACPILWSAPLGLAVVMPRVAPLPDDVDVPPAVRRLAGHDDKPDSYGIHAGRVVAVDYHGDVCP